MAPADDQSETAKVEAQLEAVVPAPVKKEGEGRSNPGTPSRGQAGAGKSCPTDSDGAKEGRAPAEKLTRLQIEVESNTEQIPDGYKWRKYGEKVVRIENAAPSPGVLNFTVRSYFKCSTQGVKSGCKARKHVERSPKNNGCVIATYEGGHNHPPLSEEQRDALMARAVRVTTLENVRGYKRKLRAEDAPASPVASSAALSEGRENGEGQGNASTSALSAPAGEVKPKQEEEAQKKGGEEKEDGEEKKGEEEDPGAREERRRRAEKILTNLTCSICGDLYKEATTITECLHSFCRTCIDPLMQMGSNANKCPVCGIQLATDPYSTGQIQFDRVLNDIVVKLFPRASDGARSKEREERFRLEQALKRQREQPKPPPPKKAQRTSASTAPQSQPPQTYRLGHLVARKSAPAAATSHGPAPALAPVQIEAALPAATAAGGGGGGGAAGAAAAAATAPASILRIRVDRAEDSKTLPELMKPTFKIYTNVTVRTLTQHVIRRIAKTTGRELPPGEEVQLFLVSDNPIVAKRALNPTVRMEQIAAQVGEFRLEYRERM